METLVVSPRLCLAELWYEYLVFAFWTQAFPRTGPRMQVLITMVDSSLD